MSMLLGLGAVGFSLLSGCFVTQHYYFARPTIWGCRASGLTNLCSSAKVESPWGWEGMKGLSVANPTALLK